MLEELQLLQEASNAQAERIESLASAEEEARRRAERAERRARDGEAAASLQQLSGRAATSPLQRGVSRQVGRERSGRSADGGALGSPPV